MTDSESLQWQPLSALPEVSRDVDEQFTNTREQYEQLLRARDQPHLLDDAIVARVIRLVTDELEFLSVYREQLARWYQSQPAPGQFIELDRMTHQLDRWRELLEQQLALAQDLNVGTIDKVLAKSDHELAAALLAGDMKFPPANVTNAALVAAARVQMATVIDHAGRNLGARVSEHKPATFTFSRGWALIARLKRRWRHSSFGALFFQRRFCVTSARSDITTSIFAERLGFLSRNTWSSCWAMMIHGP